MNLDFFLFAGCATCRCVTAALTNPDAVILRAPLEIPLCSSQRRPIYCSVTVEGGEPRWLCTVCASDVTRLDCRTAAVPNTDPWQVWLDCHFPIYLSCFWPAHYWIYEVGEFKTKKRKVLEIFNHSKVFGLVLPEPIPSCFILPRFSPHYAALWTYRHNRIFLITCACLQSGYTVFRLLLQARVRCCLNASFGKQVLLLFPRCPAQHPCPTLCALHSSDASPASKKATWLLKQMYSCKVH